jgi:hypothetical protein
MLVGWKRCTKSPSEEGLFFMCRDFCLEPGFFVVGKGLFAGKPRSYRFRVVHKTIERHETCRSEACPRRRQVGHHIPQDKRKPPASPENSSGVSGKRLAAPTGSAYWQASQSGSSMAQAFGTGAGPAGAARTESSPWLPPLETAFSLPVLMVDFSVLVAARARR